MFVPTVVAAMSAEKVTGAAVEVNGGADVPVLRVRGLRKTYRNGDVEVHALRDVDLGAGTSASCSSSTT